MAVKMPAIGNGKGMGFCSEGGPQSSWVRLLGCSFSNSYPQFPNTSILGMRNLLHLCDFSYYLNADFLRFPPPSCPPALLTISYLWFPLPYISSWLVSCWVKCTSSSFFPFPPFSPTAGSFPVQQPWPYLRFLPFPPLQLTLSVNSTRFPLLHPPKADHASCWICCHFFPCWLQSLLFWSLSCVPPCRKLIRVWPKLFCEPHWNRWE